MTAYGGGSALFHHSIALRLCDFWFSDKAIENSWEPKGNHPWALARVTFDTRSRGKRRIQARSAIECVEQRKNPGRIYKRRRGYLSKFLEKATLVLQSPYISLIMHFKICPYASLLSASVNLVLSQCFNASTASAGLNSKLPDIIPSDFSFSGNVSTYYIQAEQETWDYVPTGLENVCNCLVLAHSWLTNYSQWLCVPLSAFTRAYSAGIAQLLDY
jgi:hypothetical protein